MSILLSIQGPDTQARKVEFEQSKVTIGSNPLCEVVVDHPGVDAEQAVIVMRGERLELFDIGESGGVLVNGKPQGHAVVEPGDEIWVGGTVLRVLAPDEDAVAFTETPSTVRAEVAPEQVRAPSVPVVPALPAAPKDQRFALLDRVGGLINTIASDEDTFESILDTLFSAVPVRRGFIALSGTGGDLKVKAHRNIEKSKVGGGPIEVSKTLIGKVLESGTAVLTSDAESDPDLRAAQSIHRLRIKAAICVPLVSAGRVIGIVYGDNREQPGALTKDHLVILTALASVAAAAVETGRLLEESDAKRKLDQALSIARSIQRNFLPSGAPETEWLEMFGRSDSCDETGGDYYDFFPMEQRRTGVVIADVTGHGVGSALLMATVRAALRALVQHEPSLEKLVFRLNNLIRDDVHDGRFITFFMGRFDPATCRFQHVGAGHTPPIFYRARDSSTHLVRSNGPPLGILAGMEFSQGSHLPLDKGDILLFTTDGIMEAADESGEQFGLTRLRQLVVEHAGGSAQELVEAICDRVEEFAAGALIDDATLVAVKVLSKPV